MGRPFAVIGFTMFATLFFVCLIGQTAAFVVLSIALAALTVLLIVKKLRSNRAFICAASAAAFSCCLYLAVSLLVIAPVKQYCGKSVKIQATVLEYASYQYDRYFYQVQVESVDGKQVDRSFKVSVSFQEEISAEPYDSIVFQGVLNDSSSSNRMTMLNRYSNGIYASCYCSSPVQVSRSSNSFYPPGYYITVFRHRISAALKELMPHDNAALCAAVILGDKSDISSEYLKYINQAGISHIICVSGLHLSILGFAILKGLSFLKLRRKLKLLLSACFILLFMFLCGFTNSVSRAGCMFLLVLAAGFLRAEPDSLNSLGFASMLILLNPFSAVNIGFVFSFSATLAIITVASKLNACIRQKLQIDNRAFILKRLYALAEILLVSLCVNVLCLPFSILFFGKVSVISLTANVLILPIASALLISAAVAALLALLPLSVFGVFAYPPAFCASFLSGYILKATRALSSIRFANISVSGAEVYICLGVTLLLIASAILIKRRKRRIFLAGMALSVFICGTMLSYYNTFNRMEICVHALKDNVCISVTHEDDCIIIDAGAYSNTLEAVEQSMFRAVSDDIDYFILSSDRKNESGKTDAVCAHFTVQHVLVPQNSTLEAVGSFAGKSASFGAQITTFKTESGMILRLYHNGFTAIQIEYASQKVLFINSSRLSLDDLPKDFQAFEYLILTGKADNHLVKTKTNGIIEIVGKESISHRAAIEKAGIAYYSTARGSDVQLHFSAEKSTIGRKNAWQQ